jgi:oxygen-independent coproporphyrinogen-3 oxidase
MFELTVERLASAGFERYEVSNFARRTDLGGGGPCRHNLVYWRHGQWLAAGPSASAHVGGHRWKNVARVGEWMQGVSRNAGASPIVDHEAPDARRALAERLMMGIRLAEGLDEVDVLTRAAVTGCDTALATCVRTQIERGLIERVGDRIRLTSGGFLVADGVASSLMACVD